MSKPNLPETPIIIGGRRQPVQKRARLTVQSILQAAEGCFAEDGYANASTNRIAERAGVAISSLYQYFPDKLSIYLSLYSQTLSQVANRLNRQIITVIHQDLNSAMGSMVAAILEEYEEHQLILLHLADDIPEIRSGKHYFNLSNLIYDTGKAFLQQKLEDSGDQAQEQIFFFLHTITFASLRGYLLEEEEIFDRQTFIDELTRLIVNFLRDRVGGELP